jgi:phthiocerol/phenolphthiocerol synthesis type-I polyketide synthase C
MQWKMMHSNAGGIIVGERRMQSMGDIFSRAATLYGEKTAHRLLKANSDVLDEHSYLDLHRSGLRIARALALHINPGDRVILAFRPGLRFIEALAGCAYAGGVAVPVNPPMSGASHGGGETIEAIAADCAAAVILREDPVAGGRLVLADLVTHTSTDIAFDRGEYDGALDVAIHVASPDDIAILQYTSGSTGSPKGVMVSHRNLLSNLQWMVEIANTTDRSVILSWVPHYHDLGLFGVILHNVFVGATGLILSPLDFLRRPLRWLELVSRYRATSLCAPNFGMELAVEALARSASPTELDLSCVEVIVCGAEPVQARTLRRFVEAFRPYGFSPAAIAPAYGMAEATVLISAHRSPATADNCLDPALFRLEDDDLEAVSCGRATEGDLIVIVDPDTGRPVEPGWPGEIWLSGACVAAGYWNKPDLTESTFRARLPEWPDRSFLRTGDLGSIDNGRLFIRGRIKNLIIIRGQNLYPADIEAAALAGEPRLKPGGIAALGIATGGSETAVLIAETAARGQAQLEAIAVAVRRAVGAQMGVMLGRVVLTAPSVLPKTSSGKVRYATLARQLADGALRCLLDWQAVDHSTGSGAGLAPTGRKLEDLRQFVVSHCAAALSVRAAEIDPSLTFLELGFDSAGVVGLAAALSVDLDRDVSPTLLLDHPTCIELSAKLVAGDEGHAPGARRARTDEPVAIIGLACRFPGASDPAAFWDLLAEARCAVGKVPADRWNSEALWDGGRPRSGRCANNDGGFIDGVDDFDADFFKLSQREAAAMDPQQRLLLEIVCEALADGGVPRASLAGSDTGVFVGVSSSEHQVLQLAESHQVDAYFGTGHALSITANRISHVLDLRGPSLVVDTACSSSLVAVHMARRAVLEGDATLAIAAGANLIFTPVMSIGFSQAGVMSPSGRCHPFEARADGYVRGEGLGVVVLKRLSAALRDKDRIYGVVLGSAVNHGGASNGLMSPRASAQTEVIRRAMADAGIEGSQVQYIEAHGTGTRLGDRVEVEALARALGPCEDGAVRRLGSVKANIGHMEAAAGIGGLIKTLLALEHRQFPPNPNFETANPELALERHGFRVQRSIEDWPAAVDGRRIAGVTSIGFGGANAHVVLADAPQPEISLSSRDQVRGSSLVLLSARDQDSLRSKASQVSATLRSANPPPLSDLCSALARRADHDLVRLAALAQTPADAVAQLEAAACGTDAADLWIGGGSAEPLGGAFVFSGQGPRWTADHAPFGLTSPFQQVFEACGRALSEVSGTSLVDLQTAHQRSDLGQALAQPLLVATQIALAQQWQALGARPKVVLGHSLGEISAACVADAISIQDAMRIAHHRGRLAERLRGAGGMGALQMGEADTRSLLHALSLDLDIAAVNDSMTTIVSGRRDHLDALASAAAEQGRYYAALEGVDMPSHSRLVDQVVDEFEAALEGVAPRESKLPMISAVTGARIEGEALGARYWARNFREPVRFLDGLRTLRQDTPDYVVEVAPFSTLARAVAAECPHLPVVRGREKGRSLNESVLSGAAVLYCLGVTIDLAANEPGPPPWAPLPRPVWRKHRFTRQPFDRIGRDQEQGEITFRSFGVAALPGDHFAEALLTPAAWRQFTDHRVQGVVVAPAAAFINWIVANAPPGLGHEALTLEDMSFAQALCAQPERVDILQITYRRLGDKDFDVAVASRAADSHDERWTTHATARLLAQTAQVALYATAGLDVETLAENCPQVVDLGQFYDDLRRRGIDHGPAFRLLAAARRRDGEAVAELIDHEGSELSQLDAPMLDNLIQAAALALSAAALEQDPQATFVPAHIDRIDIQSRSGRPRWAHACATVGRRALADVEVDVAAYSGPGRLLLEIQGLRVGAVRGRINPAASSSPAYFYDVHWRPVSLPGSKGRSAGRWLVLSADTDCALPLAERLRAAGDEAQIEPLGPATDMLASQLKAFFADAGGSPPGVILLLPANPTETTVDQEAAAESLRLAMIALQASYAHPDAARLLVVTRGGQVLEGDRRRPQPAHSAITGLFRSARAERLDLMAWTVDVDDNLPHVDVLDAVVAEATTATEAQDSAWRQGVRYAPFIAEAAIGLLSEGFELDPRKLTLISGGLGALGLASARVLVRLGARRLCLIGRSSPDAAAKATLADLAEAGPEVVTIAADIADETALRANLAAHNIEVGDIGGVIHAAGVLDPAAIPNLSETMLVSHLRAKLVGAGVLERIADAPDLGFFLVFSSAAGVIGAPGQGAYAAANAALDAFARDRVHRGLPAQSVCWGPWAEAGMAMKNHPADSGRGRFADVVSKAMMSVRQGEAALESILTREGLKPGLIVLAKPMEDLLAHAPTGLRTQWSTAAEPGSQGRSRPRPPLRNPFVAPTPGLERELVALWEDATGFSGLGVCDDLIELGGDSIIAGQILSQIKAVYGVTISQADALVTFTVRAIAEIVEPRGAERQPSRSSAPETARQ